MRFLLRLAIVLVTALCASLFGWWQNQGTGLSKAVVPVKEAAQPADKPRPVYPHSVVPGGVTSGKELRQAIESDKVVAKHYEGVNPERMKPVKLGRNTSAYVSFRVKDKTYWTKRKVRLQKGEILLRDGEDWIRARCGNRIAFVPQRPFLPPAAEPFESDFDYPAPDIPPEVADMRMIQTLCPPVPEFPHQEIALVKPLIKPESLLREPYSGVFGIVPLPARPLAYVLRSDEGIIIPPPITDVPEPWSMLLVSGGLAAIGVFRRRGK